MAQTDDIHALVSAIYDAALEPERWPSMLERFGDLFGGSASALLVQNLPSGFGFTALVRFDPAYLALARTAYADPRRNPMAARWYLRHPVGVPKVGGQAHDRREFYRSEMYNDLMRPQRLQDGAMALLVREPDHCVIWNLMQPHGAEPFGEQDERLLQLLVPHLQRAMQLFLRVGALEARVGAAEEALDRLPLGVALVNAKGKVLHLNRTAEAIVASSDGLWVGREALGAATPRETRELHRLIAEAAAAGCGEGMGSGGALALSRPSGGQPLAVLVAPYPGTRLADGGEWPAANLFVCDPEREDVTPTDLLRRLYGLTGAEAAVAAVLLQGKDVTEAAEELAISLHTARTHVKAVLAKTGARRQAELIRLLLRGPAGLLVG
jgi:DNA-binding CsgD family transcriptional regulator